MFAPARAATRDDARSSRSVARVAMDACCVSAMQIVRTKTRQRTAKSCGPGAATLASIHAAPWQRGNGDNKGRSPGRARISRKAIARGKPGCLGCTCQTRVRPCLPIAHGAAGAASARLSLRPQFEREQTRLPNLGQNLPREQRCSSIHVIASKSIPAFFLAETRLVASSLRSKHAAERLPARPEGRQRPYFFTCAG